LTEILHVWRHANHPKVTCPTIRFSWEVPRGTREPFVSLMLRRAGLVCRLAQRLADAPPPSHLFPLYTCQKSGAPNGRSLGRLSINLF